jgi:hypothetical protein
MDALPRQLDYRQTMPGSRLVSRDTWEHRLIPNVQHYHYTHCHVLISTSRCDRRVLCFGAVAVVPVTPSLVATATSIDPKTSEYRYRVVLAVRVPTLACTTIGGPHQKLPRSAKTGRWSSLHPTPNCDLTASSPAHVTPSHHRPRLRPTHPQRNRHNGQHQLADDQHRCPGPGQPRQLRPELPHASRRAHIDRRCPEHLAANTAIAERRRQRGRSAGRIGVCTVWSR